MLVSRIFCVRSAVYTVMPGALVISSGPFSPAIKVLGVLAVPRANVGSCGIFTPLPPTTGTQSGILMLLSPAIAPLIIPIMPFITPFAMPVRASHAPENTLFIPSQACPQLPEKTPVINWIRPDRTVARPFTTPPMVLNTFWKIASTDGNTA